ncbi:hypothetical protein [Kutzneria buriramensis]|uniref:Uncharacterized protein n=1 Tax=Kutzneria buriramensis TaxID=1045776 RepID=A0A3E0H2A1_9PSEU|nr:hypothetical protein [Kutzneria buriramensis]REH37010.1 hypothetical protein BCF44_11514 [Kutzneria buriramensis]
MTEEWSFETAREPAAFAAAIAPREHTQHAYDGENHTLCGLSTEPMELYLHHFDRYHDESCPECGTRAAAAPTEPCGQERLYNRLLEADASPARENLLAALRRGAYIRLWITGPGRQMAQYYLKPDRITEGRDAVAAAFDTDDSVGLARAESPTGNFVVALAFDAPPVIARSA